MTITKTATFLHNGTSVSAGGANNNGTALDLSDKLGCVVHIRITNATGPSAPGQCQIEHSNDGGTTWWPYANALFVAGVTSSTAFQISFRIDEQVKRIRAVVGGNTVQAVTYDVWAMDLEVS